MIILKDVKKEAAMRVPDTPYIIHEMCGNRIDISIEDEALDSIVYKKDMLLITFDIDHSIAYNFEWIIDIRKDDFMYAELY